MWSSFSRKLVAVTAIAVLQGCNGNPSAAPPAESSANEITQQQLPCEAHQTLQRIRAGGPFVYDKDGSTFRNRERRLVRRARGYYTEYTVRTPGSADRGPRRIVAGQGATGDPATSGEYWYTDDHYQTFRRIQLCTEHDRCPDAPVTCRP